jgi:phosphoenolpyruvate carboxylase
VSFGINNSVIRPGENDLSATDRKTMDELASISYKAYQDFKSHPKFIPYLERMSTLPYYSKTNIGSRPSKRGKSKELVFSDLRAIPFVGSWSLLKQNVPGFFGVGSALKAFKDKGAWEEVKSLYSNSRFFRTLLFNSMMSLTKSFFQLTQYMEKDEEFGNFWKLIYKEYELSHQLLLEVTEMSTLMENELAGKASIKAREEIVLPLLTIQQYALMKIQDMQKTKNADTNLKAIYEALITRSLFGNINASRNSA